MSCKELNEESNSIMKERLEMVMGRLFEIEHESEIEEVYAQFFKAAASYILALE